MEIVEHTTNNYKKNNKNSNNGSLKILLLFILALAIGAFAMYLYIGNNPKIVTKDRIVSNNTVTEESMEEAIDSIYDAVLCIEVMNDNGDVLSTGTGFVYDKDDKYGYVLTNSHVVSSGKNIQATLSNNNVITLTILGTDTYLDLAVLRMDAKDVLKVASIGTSENTKVGNTVFTVGSPMGSSYAGTVTKGILSGKDRLIETNNSSNGVNSESYIVKVLQTDAAISPGNSGGPLVNLAGDVIGINSLKLVDDEVEGMGFAIPIEEAMNYVDILKQGKAVQRPIIGVQIIDLTNKYLLYRNNINVDQSIKYGIVLVRVEDGYPAQKGGLKEGDIITKVDNEVIKTTAEFKYQLYKHTLNDIIEVTYYRNGKEEKASIKLDKLK